MSVGFVRARAVRRSDQRPELEEADAERIAC